MAKIFDYKKYKINLNDKDVSDVINQSYCLCEHKKIYKNLTTGKYGYKLEKVIRKNRRFLVLHDSCPYDTVLGFYVKHVKNPDVVIIVKTELESTGRGRAKWTEKYRCVVDLKGILEVEETDPFPLDNCLDICGQAVFIKDSSNAFFSNYVVGARHEVLSYFGGNLPLVSEYSWPYRNLFHKFSSGDSFYDLMCPDMKTDINFSYDGKKELISKSSVAMFDGDDYKIIENTLDVPKEFTKKAFRFGRLNLLNAIKYGLETRERACVKENKVGLIQNIDGMAVQRNFLIYYSYGYSMDALKDLNDRLLDGTEIFLKEFSRCNLGAKFNKNKNIRELEIVPIYMDGDLKGTPIEHTSKIINDWIPRFDAMLDEFERIMEDSGDIRKFSVSIFDNCSSLMDSFYIKYKKHYHSDIVPYCINKLINYFIFSPTLEKLFNMQDYSGKYLRSDICSWVGYSTLPSEYIIRTFGDYDDSYAALHMNLGLPKGMLQYCVENNFPLNHLKFIKEIFAANESSKQYFQRMNCNEYAKLVMAFNDFDKYCYSTEIINTIKRLIDMYGVKNWYSYFVLIKQTIKKGGIRHGLYWYSKYITMVYELKDEIYIKDWKLTGADVATAVDRLEAAYQLMQDKEKYKKAQVAFDALSPIWEKYEYKQGDYIITYPKTPYELAVEGTKLRHCVKNFVEVVANGKTIILFIRKQDEPEKPYYTLEIREGVIRQCHGFDNCNIEDTDKSLAEFLQSFCKDKNIQYSGQKAALGI